MKNQLRWTEKKDKQRELDYEKENKRLVIATIVVLIAGLALLAIMFIALQEVLTWTP